LKPKYLRNESSNCGPQDTQKQIGDGHSFEATKMWRAGDHKFDGSKSWEVDKHEFELTQKRKQDGHDYADTKRVFLGGCDSSGLFIAPSVLRQQHHAHLGGLDKWNEWRY
jgi:hypothetical protein